MEDYRGGRLVVPEFQREYVWKPSRAPKLIDSIYRGFPISVLLLWTSDVETRSRRKDPKPTRSGLISWLIDGQQRVITLSRILSGDEGIDVVFNPYEDAFRLANAATNRDNSRIRVSEILDDESYRQLRRTLPDGSKGEKLRLSLSVSGRFYITRSQRFGCWTMTSTKLLKHSPAFNTLGVKLKTEDIESARVRAHYLQHMRRVDKRAYVIFSPVEKFCCRQTLTGITSCLAHSFLNRSGRKPTQSQISHLLLERLIDRLGQHLPMFIWRNSVTIYGKVNASLPIAPFGELIARRIFGQPVVNCLLTPLMRHCEGCYRADTSRVSGGAISS